MSKVREALESAIEVTESLAKQLDSDELWTHLAMLKETLAADPEPAGEPVAVEFIADLQRSRSKHPGIKKMFDGLLGEVHELKRAYQGDGDVRAEAFDVAVCAYRIATEGDEGENRKIDFVPDWMAWGATKPTPEPEPAGEPVAFEFQHEDTGLVDFIDPQQVEWGFQKNNPRWKLIAPVYRHPTPEAVRKLVEAQSLIVQIAGEAFEHWDNDRDAKVGKLLSALSGQLRGYDIRVDRIHDAIAEVRAAEQAKGE